MKGKLYEESKRDNKCEICGDLIPRGTPTYLQMIDGNWVGWCPKHGPMPLGSTETALDSLPGTQAIVDSLEGLKTGVSRDFGETQRMLGTVDMRLCEVLKRLETLIAQGAK